MAGCIGLPVRPLLEEAYNSVEPGGVSVAVAPTSYGKTVASPWMWRRAREEGLAGGLVHVAPLRSLVRRAYDDLFKPCGGRLQMHGADDKVKSPYLLSTLVVSTLDSFLWNLYRIPVAEALKVQSGSSMGHYYPSLLSIFTSLVVFDEGHMYLWEDPYHGDPSSTGAAASLAAIAGLAWAGAPVVVETATAQPSMIANIRRVAEKAGGRATIKALKAPRGSTSCPYIDKLRSEAGALEDMDDPEWESSHLVPWKTFIEDDWEGVVDSIVDDASSGPVLVVANTVGEAVDLYGRLKSIASRVVLIHGRLSNSDRSKAEEDLHRIESEGGVVVSTQVAEAGLDVNSAAVYTSAAPLESIVQRAGRACRRGGILESCMEDGGKVVIVAEGSPGPYPKASVEETVKLISEIVSHDPRSLDWRAPCNRDSIMGYGTLIALHHAKESVAASHSLVEQLLQSYLKSDARPWALLKMIEHAGLCGLARDSIMVEVDVGDSAVPASLQWVLSNAQSILEFRDNLPVVTVEWSLGRRRGVAEGRAARLWSAWNRARLRGGCEQLVKSLALDALEALKNAGVDKAAYTVRLKAKEGVYKPGLGLVW